MRPSQSCKAVPKTRAKLSPKKPIVRQLSAHRKKRNWSKCWMHRSIWQCAQEFGFCRDTIELCLEQLRKIRFNYWRLLTIWVRQVNQQTQVWIYSKKVTNYRDKLLYLPRIALPLQQAFVWILGSFAIVVKHVDARIPWGLCKQILINLRTISSTAMTWIMKTICDCCVFVSVTFEYCSKHVGQLLPGRPPPTTKVTLLMQPIRPDQKDYFIGFLLLVRQQNGFWAKGPDHLADLKRCSKGFLDQSFDLATMCVI